MSIVPPSGLPVGHVAPPSKSILLIGDSIIKHVNVTVNGAHLRKVCLRGASIPAIQQHLCSLPSDSFDVVLLHCGTNSVRVNDYGFISNSEKVLRDFDSLLVSVKTRFPLAKVIVSGLTVRRDLSVNSVFCFNDFVSRLCRSFDFLFIDPNSSVSASDLGRDGLHLNRNGSRHLSNCFKRVLLSDGKN